MNEKTARGLLWMCVLGVLGMACVNKPEEMVGPTIGKMEIVADENLKSIVQQEEQIFERNYQYAHLDITYTNEFDMFRGFLADTAAVIIATRDLTSEEKSYFQQRQVTPRIFPFATSAIAFVKSRNSADTTFVYEELLRIMRDSSSGAVIVLENAKSGIAAELLRLMEMTDLPGHFYALKTKQEVLEYIKTHDNAIGVIDYSDISDSDTLYTKEVLSQVHLLGISRPADSTQVGFVKPFQYNLQDRKYPFTRDLYVISTTGRSDIGVGFASFISGEIGQKIVLKAGLLPKFQSERNIEFRPTDDITVVK